MNKIKASIIGIAVFLVLLSAVSAVDATVVEVDPASQTVSYGQPFSVNISVDYVTSMTDAAAVLHFDPNAMQATNIIEGLTSGYPYFMAPYEVIDNEAGKVEFSYNLAIGSNVSGSGPLATIEFTANESAEGMFDLELTDVVLYNVSGLPIQLDAINDGTVSIDKTPPTMTIITPIEENNYSSTCVKLNVSAQDDESGIDCMWYSLDEGENVTIFDNGNAGTVVYGKATISDLDPCEHSIVVYVNNTVGKMNSNEVSFTVYPGDIDFSGKVWVGDVVALRAAYSSRPGDDNWNVNADLDCNDHIWVGDVVILRENYTNDYGVICGI